MPIPTNRTTSNTPAEHVSDHNLLHAFYNQYEGFPPSTFASATHTHDVSAITSGVFDLHRLGTPIFGGDISPGVLRAPGSGAAAVWAVLPSTALGDYNPGGTNATGDVLTRNSDGTVSYKAAPGASGGLTTEQVQDVVAAMILGGAGVAAPVYDDNAGTLTISLVGGNADARLDALETDVTSLKTDAQRVRVYDATTSTWKAPAAPPKIYMTTTNDPAPTGTTIADTVAHIFP